MTHVEEKLFFPMRDKSRIDFIPVHYVPERLDKFCPVVLVIQVICMLPDIESHKNPISRHHIDIMFLKLEDHETSGIHAIREHSPPGTFDTRRLPG